MLVSSAYLNARTEIQGSREGKRNITVENSILLLKIKESQNVTRSFQDHPHAYRRGLLPRNRVGARRGLSVLEEDLQDVTGITRASTVHTVQNIVNFFGATPNQFLVIGDDNASIGGESSGQPG